MSVFAILFLLVTGGMLLTCPRRNAPLPLLMGCCYITLGQGVIVGPFSFTLIRILILIGWVRLLVRRERPPGPRLWLDKLFFIWAGWALFSSVFHKEPGAMMINNLGMVYNGIGVYMLFRCFCQTEEDLRGLLQVMGLVLVPVALAMCNEQLTGKNLFAVFGGVEPESLVRNGRIRSQGPFAHAILAGTVGAVCAPLLLGVYQFNRKVALIGLGACLLIVVASASSGPLLSVIFGCLALLLWKKRHWTRRLRIGAICLYILLDLVMKAPAYYLLARIDLTGSSTGYHRAALIESSIKHFNEWWLAGTDYTRHWMPYGVSWSPDHADITNHFLAQGVRGGFLLMVIFMAMMWCGFCNVGAVLARGRDTSLRFKFLAWVIGACLLAHAATMISVAYFDQSVCFLYMTLAASSAIRTFKTNRLNGSVQKSSVSVLEADGQGATAGFERTVAG